MKAGRRDVEVLIEEAAGSWRPANTRGEIRSSPAWHDLDEAARREVYEVTLRLRKLEAAMDSEGLSTTARRVLDRIRKG